MDADKHYKSISIGTDIDSPTLCSTALGTVGNLNRSTRAMAEDNMPKKILQ